MRLGKNGGFFFRGNEKFIEEIKKRVRIVKCYVLYRKIKKMFKEEGLFLLNVVIGLKIIEIVF